MKQEKWLWFDTSLTLENYKDTLSGKTITYLDANGNTIHPPGQ